MTSTSVQGNFTTDGTDGIAYVVLVPDGDTPSAAQIKAGTNSSDTAALGADNVTISFAVATDLGTFSSLTADTAYELAWVHTSGAAVDSNVVTTGFTTLDDEEEESLIQGMDPDEWWRRRRLIRHRRYKGRNQR